MFSAELRKNHMIKQLFRSNPHGWVIVGVSFVTLSLVFSARSSLGLLMPTWEQELGWARSFVSGGGAIMLVVMAAIAPIAGNFLDRVGPRLLYGAGLTLVGFAVIATGAMGEKWHFITSFSAVGGIGFGIVGVPLMATTVALYFERNRGLATSPAPAGGKYRRRSAGRSLKIIIRRLYRRRPARRRG